MRSENDYRYPTDALELGMRWMAFYVKQASIQSQICCLVSQKGFFGITGEMCLQNNRLCTIAYIVRYTGEKNTYACTNIYMKWGTLCPQKVTHLDFCCFVLLVFVSIPLLIIM